MEIIIHKNIIGYDHHILIDENGKIVHINEPFPKKIYIYGIDDELNYPGQCIQTILQLNGLDKNIIFPQEKYQKSMSILTRDKNIPWSLIIPKDQYIDSIKLFSNHIISLFNKSRKDYYKLIYPNTQFVISSLKPCKLNSRIWIKYINDNKNETDYQNDKTILESFQQENNLLKPTIYSRETKTGRFKVKSGPNILRLKKEQRNILKSRFDGGRLYYLDFRSLEPRTTLAINKVEDNIPIDIYKFIIDKFNITSIKREHIKQTILSQLFGASEEKVMNDLKNHIDNPRDFIRNITSFFGMEELKNNLIQQTNKNDRYGFYNHYGRWLDCEDAKPYMFINYFIQSTAVDIALIGFSNIIKFIANSKYKNKIIPAFILHDALILDVSSDICNNSLNELCEIGSQIADFPNTKFFLDCQPVI